jgi:hypothetical protein
MNVAERRRFGFTTAVVVLGLSVLAAGCGSKKGNEATGPGRSETHAQAPTPAPGSEAPATATETGPPAPVIQVTDKNFEAEVLKSKDPVLVDFWTET